ncbi:MAG: hypothetical protein ACREOO_27570 [bacterium]
MKGGIFQRGQSALIDADRGGDDAGHAAFGKALLEILPRRRDRAIIVGSSSPIDDLRILFLNVIFLILKGSKIIGGSGATAL